MQLILPQSDLEQAIKDYVNDLVNIKEGTIIEIDLKAGRGLDGFTATVDINKLGTPSAPKTVVPAATPLPAQTPVAAPVKPIPRATPVPVPETVADHKPEKAPEPTPEPVAEKTADPVPETESVKSEQPQAAAVEVPEAASEVATPVARRPLFGNLKKPE